MFGETFLAKRYAAGREEGVEIGRGQGRDEERSEFLKFLGENPEATAKEVEEWARNRDLRRNGKERRD